MATYPDDEDTLNPRTSTPLPPTSNVGTPLPPAATTVDTAIAKPPAPLPADEPFERFKKIQASAPPTPDAPPAPVPPVSKLPPKPEGVDPFDNTTPTGAEGMQASRTFLKQQGVYGDPEKTARLQESYAREEERDARAAQAEEGKTARETAAASKREETAAVRQMAAAGVETRIADDGTTVPVTDGKTGRPVYKPAFDGDPRYDDATKSWVRDWRNADGTKTPVDMHENGQIKTDRETGDLYFSVKGKRTVVGKDEQFLKVKNLNTEITERVRANTERDNTITRLNQSLDQDGVDATGQLTPSLKARYAEFKKKLDPGGKDTVAKTLANLEANAARDPKFLQSPLNAQAFQAAKERKAAIEKEFQPVRDQYEGAVKSINALKSKVNDDRDRELRLRRERDTIQAVRQRPQFAAPAAAQANETPDQTAERQRHGIGGTEWQVPDLKTEADKLNDVLKQHAERVKAAAGNTPTLANLGELDATTLGKVAEARAVGQVDVDRQTARVSALKRFDTVSANLEKEAQSTEAQRAQIVTNVRAQQKAIVKAIRAGQANATQYDALTESATKALAGLDKKLGNLRTRQTDERKALKTGLEGQQGADYPDSLIVRDGTRASVDPEAVALRAAGRSAFLHQDERQSRLDVLEEAKRGGKITHVGDQTLDDAIKTTRAEQRVTLDDVLAPAEAQNLRRGLFGLTDGTLGTELGSKYSLGVQQGTAPDGTKFGATKLDYAGSSLPTENFNDGTTMAKPIATPVDAAKDFFTNLLVNPAVRAQFPKGPQGVKGWENFTTEQKRDYVTKQGAEAQAARDEAERDKRSWGEKIASIGSAFAEGLSSIATGSIDAGVATTRLRAGVPRAIATLISTGDFARAKDALFSARPADAEWANEFSGMVQSYWHEGVDDRDRDGIAANLAEGIGSAVGFTAAGGVVGKVAQGFGAGAKAIQAAQTATAAAVGAAQNGGSSYREALDRGDTDAEAFARFAVGAGLGSTEAVGLGNIMARLDKFTGGSLKKFVLETAKEGLEEGAQEALQQGGMELFDALNGSKNGIDLRTLEGWQKLGGKTLEAAQVAAVTGLIYSAGMGGIVKFDERSRRNRAQRAFETLDAKHAELSAAARSPEGLEAFNAKQVADGRKPITMATAIDLAKQVATARAAKATGMLLDDDDRAHGIARALDGTVDAAKLTAEIRNRPQLAPTLIEIGRQAGPALLTPEARTAIEAEQGAKDFASPEGTAQRRLIAGRLVVDTHLRGALEGKPVPAAIGQALEDMGLLVRRPLPNLPDGSAQTQWVVSAPGLELMPGNVRAAVMKAPDNFAVNPVDTSKPGELNTILEKAGDEMLSAALKPAPAKSGEIVAPSKLGKVAPSTDATRSPKSALRADPTPVDESVVVVNPEDTNPVVARETPVRETQTAPATPKNDNDNLQFTLPKAPAAKVLAFGQRIPDSELYTGEEGKTDSFGGDGYGREGDPHVTLLYGPNQEPATIAKAIEEAGLGAVEMTLGKVSVFSNDDSPYDVVKVDVDGLSLRRLHEALKAKFGTASSFKDYKPHITIAYVKKGKGAKYVGDTRFEGQTVTLEGVTHSDKESKRTEIPLKVGSDEAEPSMPTHRVTMETAPDEGGFMRRRVIEVTATDDESAAREARKQTGKAGDAFTITKISEIKSKKSEADSYKKGDGLDFAPKSGPITADRFSGDAGLDDGGGSRGSKPLAKSPAAESGPGEDGGRRKKSSSEETALGGKGGPLGDGDNGSPGRSSGDVATSVVGGSEDGEPDPAGGQSPGRETEGVAGAGAFSDGNGQRPRSRSGVESVRGFVSSAQEAVDLINRGLGLTGERAVAVETHGEKLTPGVWPTEAGRIRIVLNPEHTAQTVDRLDDLDPGLGNRWLESTLSEELTHVAQLLSERERWEKTSKGVTFQGFTSRMRARRLAMARALLDRMQSRNPREADEFGRVILSALDTYFSQPLDSKRVDELRDLRERVSTAMRSGDRVAGAKALLTELIASKEEGVIPHWMFEAELTRQLVQAQRQGKITEEAGSRGLIHQFAEFLREIVAKLKRMSQTPEVKAALRRINEILDLAEGRDVTVTPGPDPEGGLPVLRGKAAEAFALPAEQLRDFLRGEHVDQPKGAKRMPEPDLIDLSRHFDRMGDTRRGGIITNELAHRAAEEQAAATREGQRAQSYELLDAIAKLGGLPVTDAMQGELAQLRELPRSKRPGLFRKDGPALDRLASDLRDYGFTFEGPDDLLRALTDRLNPDGAEQYGDRIGAMELASANPASPEINRLLAKQRTGDGLSREESARLRELESAAGQGSLFGDDAMRAPSEDLRLEQQVERSSSPRMEQASLFAAAPAFYSRLEEVIGEKMPNSATPQQALAIIDPTKGSGVKEDEIKWTGTREAIADIAASNGGKVPKAALLAHLKDEGAVRFEEVSTALSPEEVRATLEGDGWTIHKDSQQSYGDDVWWAQRGSDEEKSVAVKEGTTEEVARRLLARKLGASGMREKYGQYQLPGGTNYREVVLAMPANRLVYTGENVTPIEPGTDDITTRPDLFWYFRTPDNTLQISKSKYGTEADALAYILKEKQPEPDVRENYRSSHFEEIPNYVAHMRLNDRNDSTGASGTLIEELQSDRHQQGRMKGYAATDRDRERVNEIVDLISNAGGIDNLPQEVQEESRALGQLLVSSNRIPDAPFRKDWPVQMFKRALREAVEQGKEWIGWTSGSAQTDRYDLSKQVSAVRWHKGNSNESAMWNLEVIQPGSRDWKPMVGEVEPNKLENFVGKDLAGKLVDGSPDADGYVSLNGLDLKVGGDGMIGFYDKILPSEIGKYVKKWGANVEIGTVNAGAPKPETWESVGNMQQGAGEVPIWRVAITPAMREGIETKGQALFAADPLRDITKGIEAAKEEPIGKTSRESEARALAPEQRKLVGSQMDRAQRTAAGFTNVAGMEPADVRQEAVAALVRAATVFDPTRGVPFENFASVVVKNHLVNVWRRSVGIRNEVPITDQTFQATAPTAAAGVDAAETRALLDEVVDELPARLKAIVNGRMAGRSLEDIGAEINAVPSTVARGTTVALDALRGRLKARGITGVDADGVLMAADPTKPDEPTMKAFLLGAPVSRLRGDEFAKEAGASLITRVADWYQGAHGGMATNPEIGDVVLNRRGVQDSLSHGMGRAKAAAFAAVPTVIAQGRVIDRRTNWKGRGYDTAVIAAPITIGDEERIVALVVNREQGSNRFYLHEAYLRERLLAGKKSPQGAFETGASAAQQGAGEPSGANLGDIPSLLRSIIAGNPRSLLAADPLRYRQEVWDKLIDETVPEPSWAREFPTPSETIPQTPRSDAAESTIAWIKGASKRAADAIERAAAEEQAIDTPARTVMRDVYTHVARGKRDRLEYFVPGAGAAMDQQEIDTAKAAAAMRLWKDGLKLQMKAAFGHPSYWREKGNLDRLNRFSDQLLEAAAYLNATAIDADQNFQFEDFWQRAGELSSKDATSRGWSTGTTYIGKDGHGYRVGNKLFVHRGKVIDAAKAERLLRDEKEAKKVEVTYQLERWVPASEQRAVHEYFHDEFPEGAHFLDMFISPDLANDTVVSPQGIELPAFNRHSLFNYYGSTPMGLVEKIPGYTPDVIRTRAAAGFIANLLKWNWKSPGRDYKTGQARVTGNALSLLDGFSVRAAQAHDESQRRKNAAALLKVAVKPIPHEGKPADFVALDRNMVNDFVRMFNEWKQREADGGPDLLPLTANTADQLTDSNNEMMRQIFGTPEAFNPDMMIHKVAVAELQRSFVKTRLDSRFLQGVIDWVRGSVGSGMIADLQTLANNLYSNSVFKAMLAVQKTAAAAIWGADAAWNEVKGVKDEAERSRREAKLAIRTAGNLVTSFLPHVFNPEMRQRIDRIVPREMYEDSNALRIALGQNAGKTVKELLSELNIAGAVLEGIGYGNMDPVAKQKLAAAAILARASIAADDAGITGAGRLEWIQKWAENAPNDARLDANYAAKLMLMDYGNVPFWLDEGTPFAPGGIDLTPWANLARGLILPFYKYPYNYARQRKRLILGGLQTALPGNLKVKGVQLTRGGVATKGERVTAMSNLVGYAMMLSLYWLIGKPWDPEDDQEIVGRDYDDLGVKMDPKFRTGSRVRAAKSSLFGLAINTAARMFGAQDDGSENWVRTRTIPYGTEAMALGSALQYVDKRWIEGDAAAAVNVSQGAWNLVQDFMSSGTGARMFLATWDFKNSFDQDKETSFIWSQGITDMLTARLLPPRALRDIRDLIDPVQRRTTNAPSLGYEAGVDAGAIERFPMLNRLLPPSGKVQGDANPDSEATIQARSMLAAMGLEAVAYHEYLDKKGNLRAAYVRPEYIWSKPRWAVGVRQLGFNVKSIDPAAYATEAAGTLSPVPSEP